MKKIILAFIILLFPYFIAMAQVDLSGMEPMSADSLVNDDDGNVVSANSYNNRHP